VLWLPRGGGPHSVQVIDVPSGRELFSFVLPRRNWDRLNVWRGGRLYAETLYSRKSHECVVALAEGRPAVVQPVTVAMDHGLCARDPALPLHQLGLGPLLGSGR
jgi:hypothetical protein